MSDTKLFKKHPLPWSVRGNNPAYVVDTNGRVVAVCNPDDLVAADLVAMANSLTKERKAAYGHTEPLTLNKLDLNEVLNKENFDKFRGKPLLFRPLRGGIERGFLLRLISGETVISNEDVPTQFRLSDILDIYEVVS